MTADACREWRSELAAAAIGRIDETMRPRLDAHLDACGACRAELLELERAAELVARADVACVESDDERAVPHGLGDTVVAQVRAAQARARSRRVALAVRGALVAAAVVVAALLTVAVLARGSARPSATVALRSAVARADARLVADRSGTEVRLVGSGLRDGDRYWLWLTGPDGLRVGAGTFSGESDGTFDIETYSALPFSQVRRVWVTDTRDRVVLDARVRAASAAP